MEENLTILKDSEFLSINEWSGKSTIEDYLQLSEKVISLVPLRNAAMEHFLRPENRVLINMPALERNIVASSECIDKYNTTPVQVYQSLPVITSVDVVKQNIWRLCGIMSVQYQRVWQSHDALNRELHQLR